MRQRIYISGPLTKPDPIFGRNWNLFQANWVMSQLMEAGYAPLNPMLSMGNHDEHDWNDWLELDESWLSCAHLCLRLPGASLGAERECSFARARGIPVVGPAYFGDCLKDLFQNETKLTYTREDQLNLMRFNRAQRRAAGLPAMSEAEAAILHPFVVEGFASVS